MIHEKFRLLIFIVSEYEYKSNIIRFSHARDKKPKFRKCNTSSNDIVLRIIFKVRDKVVDL